MNAETNGSLNLPAEVRDLLWRIFGPGASPMRDVSAFELIETVISKRASLPRRQQTTHIAEIRGWFQTHDEHRWLAPEMREPVAQAIIDGVRADFSKTAIWAIGAVDSEIVLPILKARWSEEEIDEFCSRALNAIQQATEREKIVDPERASRYSGIDAAKVTISREAIERDGQISSFKHLGDSGWELVHHALDGTVSNLVKLLVDLRPAGFETLIAELDHPVLQALAAECFVANARRADHRAPLRWLKPGVCDAVVALAIYHTLGAINVLDEDSRSDSVAVPRDAWRTELKPGHDDLEGAARGLIAELVHRISQLPKVPSVRWLGELLSTAPDILNGNADGAKPQRVSELEAACAEHFSARHASGVDDDTLRAFRTGLRLTRRKTWNRHVADVAWKMRTDSRDSARMLARAALDCHSEQARTELAGGHFHFSWAYWDHRNSVDALGRALVLSESSHSPNHYSQWVRSRCLELPLTIWDSEERYSEFLTADRIARHWLLVGVHAAHYASEFGQPTHPEDVRTLAELTWSHCSFAKERGCIDADASVAVEAAARAVVELGAVEEKWLVGQAARAELCSRALWALADQCMSQNQQEHAPSEKDYADFADHFGRAAESRFGDATQYSINSLFYWARLWLLLDCHGPAEQTASAILAVTSGSRARSRKMEILVLKLLALTSARGRLHPEMERHFTETYRDLWGTFTPSNEQSARDTVDGYLRRSGSTLQVLP